MKFLQNTLIFSVAVLLASVAMAEKPVLSVTSVSNNSLSASTELSAKSVDRKQAATVHTLDFLAGGQSTVMVQFDVAIKSKRNNHQVDLSRCNGQTLSGSDHLVFCRQIAQDRVRVLVDSPSNSVVSTTSLGTISVIGGSISIIADSVVLGDAQANKIEAEVL